MFAEISPKITRPGRTFSFLTLLLLGTLSALAQQTSPGSGPKADAVVAADGSGQYQTVQAAINASPQTSTAAKPWTIFIKPGIYKELIYIQREKRFLHLLGSDAEKTVLTFNLYASLPGPDGKPMGTFRTPSVTVDADDFSADGVTFENSAGAVGQALAIRIDGDRTVFRHCRFVGYQDTILTNQGRHYYQQCEIRGAVDFIFGAGTDFFDACTIHCVGNGYITAASTPQEQPFGYVFSHCTITADPAVKRMFLGRPWRPYASVTYLNTSMPECIALEGWNNWGKPENELTMRNAEFASTGPGARPESRAKWVHQLTASDAAAITAEKVLGDWVQGRHTK